MTARPLAAAFAGNFQTAWYLTILCVFGLAVTAWGLFQVVRSLPGMLREGDVLLFAACVSLVTLVILFFGSLAAMVIVSLGPPVGA